MYLFLLRKVKLINDYIKNYIKKILLKEKLLIIYIKII